MIKALLYKDLKNIFGYKNSKTLTKIGLLISLILIGIICLVSKIIGYYQILIMDSMMCVIIYASSFGKDENSDAINFLKGTPVGVENIVRARFILALIFLSYSLIINLIAFEIISLFNIDIVQDIIISDIITGHIFLLYYCSFLSLCIYKFGSSKAVIVILAGAALIVGLIVALGMIIGGTQSQLGTQLESLILKHKSRLIVSVISLTLIFLNYKLSIKVIRK